MTDGKPLIAQAAKAFVFAHWEDYIECEGSNSLDLDVEFMELARRVELYYGIPSEFEQWTMQTRDARNLPKG